ncbi:hypothetical protein TNCV_3626751 [Trichonephila clavipes]|nr:hypothetical protein TNCV_3626751 [Trichonephila clavipes]
MSNNPTTWPFMIAVDFLHHENPPTWAGVEPATLGADGQRQTNYATQSALAEFDEAHFWLNGYVNKQNCRIWSEANPQVHVETP